jgi:hypothetical protein
VPLTVPESGQAGVPEGAIPVLSHRVLLYDFTAVQNRTGW